MKTGNILATYVGIAVAREGIFKLHVTARP
jgi:hypothetical protein